MPGDSITINNAAATKGSQSKNEARMWQEKYNLDMKQKDEQIKGLAAADKDAVQKLLDEQKRLTDQLATLTSAQKIKTPDGVEKPKGSEEYKEERQQTSDTLAKFRAENVENKKKDDDAIENRSTVDGVIKGLGSIAAGLVGNAQKLSVGDKYKYDSYDPTNDSRAAEFRATQNDKVLVDKYGTPIKESEEQQKSEVAAVEEQLKAIKDKIAARTKIGSTLTSGATENTREVIGVNSASKGESSSFALPSEGGGGGGGGSKDLQNVEDADTRKKNEDIQTVLESKLKAPGNETDEQKFTTMKNTLNTYGKNTTAIPVLEEFKRRNPDADFNRLMQFYKTPLSQRDPKNDDLIEQMISARGGQAVFDKKGGGLNAAGAKPAPAATPTTPDASAEPAKAQPAAPAKPVTSPATGVSRFKSKSKPGADEGETIMVVQGKQLFVTKDGAGYRVRNEDGVEKNLTPTQFKYLQNTRG